MKYKALVISLTFIYKSRQESLEKIYCAASTCMIMRFNSLGVLVGLLLPKLEIWHMFWEATNPFGVRSNDVSGAIVAY